MRRRASDNNQNLGFRDIQTAHNAGRILIVGSLYTILEIVGLILSTLGFFESDIRLPVFIIVCFHLIYLPVLSLAVKGMILKKTNQRFVYTTFYSLIIIVWGCLLNALVYLHSSDISVYSMVVLITAALFLLSPGISIPLYSAGFLFFSLLAILLDSGPSDANSMIFKALIVTLLGIALSRSTYKNRRRLYESEMNLLKANSRLKDLSLRDSMTGLFNNAYIYDFLEHALELHQGRKNSLAVMMLDLDYFKTINDSYGHSVGDSVLIEASRVMLSCTRDVDMVGRYGGEEFIIILTETNKERALIVAERIRIKISEIVFEEGISISCSIGLAIYSGQRGEDLITKADALMYEAKNKGRNRTIM